MAPSTLALAPDPALPQRDELLDPRRMAGPLAAALGTAADEIAGKVRVARIKYRFAESLRVLYEVQRGGATARVAARTGSLGNGAGGPARRSGLPPAHHDLELRAAFWCFPKDRKLPDLEALLDAGAGCPLAQAPPARAILVAYAPEKSATARHEAPDGEVLAYAKRLRCVEEARRVAAVANALSGVAPPGLVPAGACHDPHTELTWIAPLPGLPLGAAAASRGRGAWRRLGAALAALHRVAAPCDAPSPRTTLPRLQRAAGVVGAARPDLAAPVGELLDRLLSSPPPSWGDPVCLHGDLHPKNALWNGASVGFVDLEHAGRGERAMDLGSLAAALRTEGIVRGTPRVARHREAAVLDGYAQTLALPPAPVLAWHTAAALLAERALRAVNRVRPEALRHLPEIVSHALALAREARHA